jgi:hypothetical protein
MATHLVVETNPGGHRLSYVKLLAEQAEVLWLTHAGAPASPEAQEHLAPALRAGAVIVSGQRQVVLEASRVAGERGIRRIIVPDGDTHLLEALAALPVLLRRGQHLTILVMRSGRSGTSRRAGLFLGVKRALVRALATSRTVRVLQLTDCYGVGRAANLLTGADPVRDPIAVVAPAENPLAAEMASPRPWVGLCGVVDERKNPAVAARAVLQHPQAGLVLAGVQTDGTRSALAEEPAVEQLRALGRLVELPEMLTDEGLRAVVRELRAVLVLHDNDSPSGIMGIASSMGTPVVVPRGGWLERIVEITRCGVASTLDVEEVAGAITALISAHQDYSSAAASALDGVDPSDFAKALLS